MKIAIYTSKGWAGKTPIAANIALELDFAVWTNESYDTYSSFIADDKLLHIGVHEEFPAIPNGIDIVFDLAWSMWQFELSIPSAIKQSDVVLVPISNEFKSLKAWIKSIQNIAQYNPNIVVVATKLIKQKSESEKSWNNSSEFININQWVQATAKELWLNIPVLPLKFSKVFDSIIEHEKSINQLMAENPLAAYSYREVAKQADDIYQLIEQNYAK